MNLECFETHFQIDHMTLCQIHLVNDQHFRLLCTRHVLVPNPITRVSIFYLFCNSIIMDVRTKCDEDFIAYQSSIVFSLQHPVHIDRIMSYSYCKSMLCYSSRSSTNVCLYQLSFLPKTKNAAASCQKGQAAAWE